MEGHVKASVFLGVRIRKLRELDFFLKSLRIDSTVSPLYRLTAEMWVCASLNRRKVVKADHGGQIRHSSKAHSKARAFNSRSID